MMLQPTKDVLREQLALAAEALIERDKRIDNLEWRLSFAKHAAEMRAARRWWHRLMWWRK